MGIVASSLLAIPGSILNSIRVTSGMNTNPMKESYRRASEFLSDNSEAFERFFKHPSTTYSVYADTYYAKDGHPFTGEQQRLEVIWGKVPAEKIPYYTKKLVELTGLNVEQDTGCALVLTGPRITPDYNSSSTLNNFAALFNNKVALAKYGIIFRHLDRSSCELHSILDEIKSFEKPKIVKFKDHNPPEKTDVVIDGTNKWRANYIDHLAKHDSNLEFERDQKKRLETAKDWRARYDAIKASKSATTEKA